MSTPKQVRITMPRDLAGNPVSEKEVVITRHSVMVTITTKVPGTNKRTVQFPKAFLPDVVAALVSVAMEDDG